MFSLFIHNAALRLDCKGDDWLNHEAERIATTLEPMHHYALAIQLVADYCHLTSQHERAMKSWRRLANVGGFHSWNSIAELWGNGELDRIRSVGETDHNARIAKASVLVVSGTATERDHAKNVYRELAHTVESEPLQFRLLQLILLSGDLKTARETCREWGIDRQTHADNHYADTCHAIIQYFAGRRGDLDSDSKDPTERVLVNYYLGLEAFANGDLPSALEHVSKSVEVPYAPAPETYWARALKIHLETAQEAIVD